MSVVLEGEGAGHVTSLPAGIDCPPDCTEGFPEDTEVELEAVSDDASVFEGWGGTCAGASGATCELTPTDETTITVEATFGLMTTDPPPPTPPPPTPPPPSPEPPPPPSVVPFEEIDQVIRGLPWVNIAFNAPATLALGESVVVQLLLSPAQPVRRLKRQLTELGERRGARIKASNRMEARLTGVGFRIEAVTPEVQAVTRRQNTEWRWEVEPTGTGTRRLHLTLSALIDVEGTESPRTVRTFSQTLEVRVTLLRRVSGFVGDNWQWLWTALLIPVGGWMLRKRRQPA